MKAPIVEIVSTGSEILQGLYPDRNAMSLSRYLDAMGFFVRFHHATGDRPNDLYVLLDLVTRRSDLVVMTGGLGPTEDDVNREVIARLYDVSLEKDSKAEHMMRERFEMRNLPMPERNVIQAMIPRDARVFYNHHGTAPGFGLLQSKLPQGDSRGSLVALPGPPKEWIPMWETDVAPWIESVFPDRPIRIVRTLHCVMMPESTINELLVDLFRDQPGIELTLLADRGHIRIRLIATADDPQNAETFLDRYDQEVRRRLPAAALLQGRGLAWSIEEELHSLLSGGNRTLTVAESCTAGMVSSRITDVAGASTYFLRGLVVYSNEAKTDLLGVDPETLRVHGAVSRECAMEMARGARLRSRSDVALSITGIAGPDGGTPEKPVGTVWFGLDSGGAEPFALKRQFPGNRNAVREWACQQGLDLLRRWAANLPLSQ